MLRAAAVYFRVVFVAGTLRVPLVGNCTAELIETPLMPWVLVRRFAARCHPRRHTVAGSFQSMGG